MDDEYDRPTDPQNAPSSPAEWHFDPRTGLPLKRASPRFRPPTGGSLVAQIVWGGLIVMFGLPQTMLKGRSFVGVLVGGAIIWLVGAAVLATASYVYGRWREPPRRDPAQ